MIRNEAVWSNAQRLFIVKYVCWGIFQEQDVPKQPSIHSTTEDKLNEPDNWSNKIHFSKIAEH